MSYYLLDNENLNAEVNPNGKKGWYEMERKNPIQGIVLSTCEAYSATSVAKYYAKSNRKTSTHVLIDNKSRIDLLPDTFTAYHCEKSNDKSLGLEICYYSDKWGTDPKLEMQIYKNIAQWSAQKMKEHDIPLRKLTINEWNSGVKGFISHSQCNPSSRVDPGPNFDWLLLFSMIMKIMRDESLEAGEAVLEIKHEFKGEDFKLNTPPMKSDDIALWQKTVGLKDDGIYGQESVAKCIEIQIANNLEVDGIIGQKTWNTTFMTETE